MSLIADLIKNNPENWQSILKEKRIATRTYGPLTSFSYRIDADFFDPVVKEARGLILDMRDLHVVCYPFNKFSNHIEPHADDIDWSTARVQEKIDGSIIKLYWFEGRWRVATDSTVDANKAQAHNSGRTFGELFREAARLQELDYDRLNKNRTYIFELTSPCNKILIDYGPIPKIWHIGTRDNITEKELEEDIGIIKPKEYPLTDLESCIEAVKKMNDKKEFVEKEGFVVVDKDYHRVKIKSPEYIIVHSVLPNGMVSNKYLLKHIVNGEMDDILAYRPDLTERAEYIKDGIKDVEKRILGFSEYWKKKITRKGVSRKEFAREWKNTPYFPYAAPIIFDDMELDIDYILMGKLREMIERRPELNIMVGVPGSGKSVFAEKQKGVCISSDAIRKELLGDENDQTQNGLVFAEFHKRVREQLIAGNTVYADATNISAKSRKGYAEAMKIAWKTNVIIMATPYGECVKRDAERDRSVGEDVIKKVISRFEMPFAEEGFDSIRFIRACSPKEMTDKEIENILSEMDGFDQTSKWHTENLKIHVLDTEKFFAEKHGAHADRLAAILHDYGKLFTRTYNDTGAHFFGHGNAGAYRLMTEYGFPMLTEEEYMKMLLLVCYHDRVIKMKKNRIYDMFGNANARYLLDFREADVKASKRKEADMP